MENPRTQNCLSVFLLVSYAGILGLSVVVPMSVMDRMVFGVLFAASAALILKWERSRAVLQLVSLFGVLYYLFMMLFVSGRIENPAVSLMGICAASLLAYRCPFFFCPCAKTDESVSGQKRILVIDDDKTFLRLVKTHFQKKGLHVVTVSSGERGLEFAKETPPDLILLDVILPGIKGRTVCSILKEDPKTAGIPVIFVTFKSSPDDINAELAAGAVMHLTKPVDFNQLYDQVKKYLA